MILSNVSIQEALDRGWLKINPEPQPRTPSNGTECPYQTSAVDLRLGDEVAFFKEEPGFNIDLTQGNFRQLFAQNSESKKLTNLQPVVLPPRQMVIGRTLEKISLPIPDDGPSLAARVEGRSSYARCGLLVHFTAPTIHAGFSGTITLELVNLGTIPITLRAGSPVCQLIIEQVHGTPFRNDSQFQGQASAAGTPSASINK